MAVFFLFVAKLGKVCNDHAHEVQPLLPCWELGDMSDCHFLTIITASLAGRFPSDVPELHVEPAASVVLQ